MRSSLVIPVFFGAILVGSAKTADGQSPPSGHTLKLDKPENAAKAKVADLAWMQGRWTGKAFGGEAEEVWSPTLGNTMMGMFRLVKDDHVVFYEFCTLVEEDGGVRLRLKHFHPDLKGWEEKDAMVTFPLIKLEKNQAYFDGLTIQKEADDSLIMYLMIQPKGGKEREEKFVYHRQ